MTEQAPQQPSLPSGYESVRTLPETATIGAGVLPWLKEDYNLTVAECKLQSGQTFLLANAVGTHPKLVEAADGMTEKQSLHANNMLYSRLPTFVDRGYSPNIETIDNPATAYPIHCMRNKSGQRVYFTRVPLGLPQEEMYGPTFLRLAACDKNKQGLLFPVLTTNSAGQIRHRLS